MTCFLYFWCGVSVVYANRILRQVVVVPPWIIDAINLILRSHDGQIYLHIIQWFSHVLSDIDLMATATRCIWWHRSLIQIFSSVWLRSLFWSTNSRGQYYFAICCKVRYFRLVSSIRLYRVIICSLHFQHIYLPSVPSGFLFYQLLSKGIPRKHSSLSAFLYLARLLC